MITTKEELHRLNIWIAEHRPMMVIGKDGRRYSKQPRLQRLIAQAQGYADQLTVILKARGSL